MKYFLITLNMVVTMFLVYDDIKPRPQRPVDIELIDSIVMWNDRCSQHEKRYDKYTTCASLKKVIEERKRAYAESLN